jgi:LacI family transcriptional regulator
VGVAHAVATRLATFSDPEQLGPNTLRKVLQVAQDLGYTPPAGAVAEVDNTSVTAAATAP